MLTCDADVLGSLLFFFSDQNSLNCTVCIVRIHFHNLMIFEQLKLSF